MILCATFVLYYLTNTVEHKTINKLNNNPTKQKLAKPTNIKEAKSSTRNGKQIKQLTL